MTKLEMPEFQTEREEAIWWYNNQDAVGREFLEDKTLPPEYRNELSLMVEQADLEMARSQAERKGMVFEDYLRGLLHEALLAHK